MRSLHLKRIGEVWHYQRRRPVEFVDVERRGLIRFSLRTRDFHQAKILAAEHTITLEREWAKAKARGVALVAEDNQVRCVAAAETQRHHGFAPKPLDTIADDELLERLKRLLSTPTASEPEKKAVLGLTSEPKLTLAQAFTRFWDYIEDEWMRVSHDQQRVKRNVYLKAIRNFETAAGPIPLYDIERRHALNFRSWWVERIKVEGLKPYTANREINSLRRLVAVNLDIDSVDRPNPFARVRLRDNAEVARVPLTTEQIEWICRPGAMEGLHPDFQRLVQLLVNTGLRPVEAIGLELDDIKLGADIPHVHVRKNAVRGLKTDHSERLLPLIGVSLTAAEDLVAQGGWGKRLGKNMYATTVINRHFRESRLVTDKKQSLYSLRHWFQDQLTKRDVVDRAQAQLMGHKFQRPKYGFGKDLAELREIIAAFAIE